MKKSTKKWWREGSKQIKGKDIIRQVARKYGAGCVEETRFPIDLHDVLPELWPTRSVRGYQADLYITKRHGKELHRVICELDGGYHSERVEDDKLRDEAILQVYGIPTVRFDTDKLLKGEYSEEQIAERLGLT